MRTYLVTSLLLTTACCLAGQLGMAQRAAIEPLAPLRAVVRQPVAPGVFLGGVTTELTKPNASAASTAPAQSVRRALPQPVYLLNARFIISDLRGIIPKDIASIDIYKGADVPAHWRSLTEHGIISITLKPDVKLKFKSRSLAKIRRSLALSGVVSFELNGMRIDDESLRIANEAIAGLDVVRSNSETVVNIRLAQPKPTPHNDPPGTVRIRGLAGM